MNGTPIHASLRLLSVSYIAFPVQVKTHAEVPQLPEICDHPPRLSPVVGKLNFALQVKIAYNSLWLPMVLDKL